MSSNSSSFDSVQI
uniref:Uncharacterized protein n=1 Tax=Arundo donax TaxID=35708 RepID=A0A0A8YP55_ARUDO